MVAISFSEFKDKLLSGEKTQTIRPYTKHRYNQIKNAKKLQMYWKQRTKESEKLFDAELEDIFLIKFFHVVTDILILYPKGVTLTDREIETLVRRDGFASKKELIKWFYRKYGNRLFRNYFMVIRFRRI